MRTLAGVQRQGGGIRRKSKFSGVVESPSIGNSAPGRMQNPQNSVKKKKKRIEHFPTLLAPEILQFVF